MDLPSLGVTDYIVVASMLTLSTLIGVYNSFKGNSSAEDYFLGSRSFGWVPAGMSFLTTFMSAIAILGYSGEAYANGIQLLAMTLGLYFSYVWVYVSSVGVLYDLKLTSVNEYVLMRFQSASLRQFVVFLVLLKNFLYLGVCLYAPTIALTSVTGLDTRTSIYILGSICTLYSTIGGMRAVIWTDVFQMVVMFVGIVIVTIIAVTDAGGLANVWTIASEGGRMDVFDFNLNIFERHTFIYLVLFGFVHWSTHFGIDQLSIQRLTAVKSKKDLPKVFLVSAVGMTVMYSATMLCGIACYAFYKGCDPTAQGFITKKKQIVPYFVMERTSQFYGIPGLFISSLFSGTLSSLSSAINGVVAVVWTDIVKDLSIMKQRTDITINIVNKLLSLATGGILIGTAILCSYASNVIQFCFTIMGVILGPLYGMFLLGFLCPRCKSTGAWVGLLVSWVFICWIAIGSYIYPTSHDPLPFSTELCNNTLLELTNQTLIPGFNMTMDYHPVFPSVYRISYLFYPIISSIMCFTVSIVVTYLTEVTNVKADVSPTLIAPFIRRMYWKNSLEEAEAK